jgi:hypothetical protein
MGAGGVGGEIQGLLVLAGLHLAAEYAQFDVGGVLQGRRLLEGIPRWLGLALGKQRFGARQPKIAAGGLGIRGRRPNGRRLMRRRG